jgi:fructose-bisphosphate aldolase / 2-amino-3,7-dideoxy-D-threo-hept-6-ulosonate synthase
MKGKELRIRRLFGHGRTVILPMDHPIYFGPLPGIADPVGLVKDVAATPADGVLLTLATLGRVTEQIGTLASIARLDATATALGGKMVEFDRVHSVELAVASGADACVLNIYVGAENERDLLHKLGTTAEECERWGLPLVGEMIPIGSLASHYNPDATKLSIDELTEQTALSARVGAELGADIIKTSYTGSRESFRQVVEAATVPVVVAGGPCGDSISGLLKMIEDCLGAGAAGVCIGRNVWSRNNRRSLLTAICKMVHDGSSAEAVISDVEGAD